MDEKRKFPTPQGFTVPIKNLWLTHLRKHREDFCTVPILPKSG